MTINFDQTAEDYHIAVPPIPDELPERLVRIGNLNSRSLIVELGCGSGHLIYALAVRGMRAIGVDCSEKLIGLARSRDPHRLVEWITAHAEEYAPPYGPVDMYVAFEAFHLFNNKSSVLILAERHLRPGGVLCVGWCEYHWERPLREDIAEAFDEIGMPWGDWGYYTCPDYPRLVAEQCHAMSPTTLSTFGVVTRTELRHVAAFLTSIGKVTSIPSAQRLQLRERLNTRFHKSVGADELRGETKYFVSWCTKQV